MDRNILINRLTVKGIFGNNIPAYIRDVTNNLDTREEIDLLELNNRLRLLGWDEFELDDHTLQLIIADMERDQETGEAGRFILFKEKPGHNAIPGTPSP